MANGPGGADPDVKTGFGLEGNRFGDDENVSRRSVGLGAARADIGIIKVNSKDLMRNPVKYKNGVD